MKKCGLMVLATIVVACAGCFAQSVSYSTRQVCGTSVNVISADLSNPNVKVVPALAKGFCYEKSYVDESFSSMMGRFKPTAAINGTFFDKYTLKPVGSIVFDGKLVHSGGIGTAFCIKSDGSIEFKRVSGTDGRRVDWSGVDYAVCSGPTLLIDGKSVVDPKNEGFRDPHVYAKANRSALGVTASKRLLLVTMPKGATLSQEASIMKVLGAVNAINLDGGASSAMYYRGKHVNTAGRKLTNVLLVYENGKYPKEKMSWTDVWTALGTSPRKPAQSMSYTPRAQPVNTSYSNRPTDIKLYPNAKKEPVMVMEGQWSVISRTTDPFEKVVQHFRKEVGNKGQLMVNKDQSPKTAYCVFGRSTGTMILSISEEVESGKKVTVIAVIGKG